MVSVGKQQKKNGRFGFLLSKYCTTYPFEEAIVVGVLGAFVDDAGQLAQNDAVVQHVEEIVSGNVFNTWKKMDSKKCRRVHG